MRHYLWLIGSNILVLVTVSTESQSMTKETEVIIKESSVSSSGTVNIPIYRVDLSLAFRNFKKFRPIVSNIISIVSKIIPIVNSIIALNAGKGSKGGAPAAEVSLNLHVTINQTENSEFPEKSEFPENSGLQSSNMKSDVNRATRNEEVAIYILTLFYLIWIKKWAIGNWS